MPIPSGRRHYARQRYKFSDREELRNAKRQIRSYVEKAGFQPARAKVKLVLGQRATVDLQLAVAGLRQNVQVQETAISADVTTTETSGLVGERQVKDLPLNGGSALTSQWPRETLFSAMPFAKYLLSAGFQKPRVIPAAPSTSRQGRKGQG